MLNVEHLVMEVLLLKYEAYSDSMCYEVCLSYLWLMQRALSIGLILRKFNHTVVKSIIKVDAHSTNHDDVHFIAIITLIYYDFAFSIDTLMELPADIGQCLARVVR